MTPILGCMFGAFAHAIADVDAFDYRTGDLWHLKLMWRDAMDAAYELNCELHQNHGGFVRIQGHILAADNETADVRLSPWGPLTPAVRGGLELIALTIALVLGIAAGWAVDLEEVLG